MPSDQVRPSQRWKTYRSPSSEISHRSASEGTIVRSGHASTSRSNNCMQSWMFGQAIAEQGSLSFGRKLLARRRFSVGEETIKTHLRNLYEKLGASDRAHAVAIALRQRLIE